MGLGSFLKKLDPAGISSAVSIGSQLLGGLFGNKSKKKQEEAQRKAAIESMNLKQTMAEDKRLGQLGAGQSLLGQLAGKGFTNISPEAAASLGQRRTYDFSKTVPEAGAGAGSGLLSGLFGTIGDVASQYGVNKQQADAASAGEAAGPLIEDIARTPNFAVAPKDKIASSLYEDPANYKGY